MSESERKEIPGTARGRAKQGNFERDKKIEYRGVAQMVARLVWEHRRCSHRTKAKAAENPSTVRISGGSENEKKQSKMCLTTDLTTYTTTI